MGHLGAALTEGGPSSGRAVVDPLAQARRPGRHRGAIEEPALAQSLGEADGSTGRRVAGAGLGSFERLGGEADDHGVGQDANFGLGQAVFGRPTTGALAVAHQHVQRGRRRSRRAGCGIDLPRGGNAISDERSHDARAGGPLMNPPLDIGADHDVAVEQRRISVAELDGPVGRPQPSPSVLWWVGDATVAGQHPPQRRTSPVVGLLCGCGRREGSKGEPALAAHDRPVLLDLCRQRLETLGDERQLPGLDGVTATNRGEGDERGGAQPRPARSDPNHPAMLRPSTPRGWRRPPEGRPGASLQPDAIPSRAVSGTTGPVRSIGRSGGGPSPWVRPRWRDRPRRGPWPMSGRRR